MNCTLVGPFRSDSDHIFLSCYGSFKGTEPGKIDPMISHVFLKERVELSGGHFFDFAGSQSLSGYGSSKLQWRTLFSGHHLRSVLDRLN